MFRDFTEQGLANVTDLHFEYLCSAFERVTKRINFLVHIQIALVQQFSSWTLQTATGTHETNPRQRPDSSIICQETQTVEWPNLQHQQIARICAFRLDGMK